MSPRRIQLRRSKGWRKPDDAIVVARPSRWGNPFRIGDASGGAGTGGAAMTRAQAIAAYREWAATGLDLDEVRRELAGHDLACWCPLDGPCHADVLLEIANAADGRA